MSHCDRDGEGYLEKAMRKVGRTVFHISLHLQHPNISSDGNNVSVYVPLFSYVFIFELTITFQLSSNNIAKQL